MAFSPVPNIPFALPTSRLTIQAIQDPQSSRPRPQLRVKITPHLLIPCPPLPLRPIGHRIEEVLNVVLPIGGRVSMDVKVMEQGLGLLSEAGLMDEQNVQDGIRDHVRETLLANQDVLGVLHIPTLDLAPTPSFQALRPPSNLQLSMSAAQPTTSPLTKNLIPTGHLIAHLTALNLEFEWSTPTPRKKSEPKSSINEDNGDPPMHSTEVAEPGCIDPLGGRPRLESTGGLSVGPDSSTGLSTWAMHQVNQALRRIMKDCMIKRFPLLFDGPLQAYSTSFTLHRSISDSLFKFMNTSRVYDTPLEQDAADVVQNISDSQAGTLRRAIMSASNLSTRKPQPAPEPLESTRRRKGKARAEPDPPEDVVEKYMLALQDLVDRSISANSQSQPESQSQRRSQTSQAAQDADRKRRQIRLVLDEATGKIGRSAWEGARVRGRMSLGRIKLVIPGESTYQPSAAPQKRKPRGRPRIHAIPSILLPSSHGTVDHIATGPIMEDGQEAGEGMSVSLQNGTDFQGNSRHFDTYPEPQGSQNEELLFNGAQASVWGDQNLDLINQAGPSRTRWQEDNDEDEMIESDDEMIDTDDDMIVEEGDEMIRSDEDDEDDELIQDDDEVPPYEEPISTYRQDEMLESDDEMIQSDMEEERGQLGESKSGTFYMDYESSQSQCGSTQTTLSPSTSFSSVVQPESLPESPPQSLDVLYGINGCRPAEPVQVIGDAEAMERDYDGDGLIEQEGDYETIESPVMEASYKSSMRDLSEAAWESRW